MKTFDPNSVTFEQGAARVQAATKRVGLDVDQRIVTSRDPKARELRSVLRVRNVPQGFAKWQLPIVLDRAQLFMTVGAANAKVEEHSHDEGAGIRFIVSGSIRYGGHELTAGDWMYIPAGARYGFEVGDLGAVMCYCYSCCCAGIEDLRDLVVLPV